MRYDSFNSGELGQVFEWLEAQGDNVKVLAFTKDTFDWIVVVDRGVEDKEESEDEPKRMGRPKGSKNRPKEDHEQA